MKGLIKNPIWLLLLAPAVYLAWVWKALPEQVPLHYNFEGAVDRYGSKTELAMVTLLFCGIGILVYFALTHLHRIDPKKQYSGQQLQKIKRLASMLAVLLSALGIYIVYTSQQGGAFFKGHYIFAIVGALLAVVGNYMYNSKPNYFFGIRTPWALESEANWKYTHRIAGKLWVFAGILIILASLLLPATVARIVFFVIIGVITLIPLTASFVFFKKSSRASR